MANKVNNKRVEESINLIIDAVMMLMEKENYEHITITQICQEANIGRNTFYRHFNTKDNLLKYIIKRKIRSITDAFEAGQYIDIQNTKMADIEFTYRRYYEFWYSEKQFLLTIYKQKLFYLFSYEYAANLNNYVFDSMIYSEQHETGVQAADFFYACSAASLTSLLYIWTAHGFVETIDFMVKTTIRIRCLKEYNIE